MRDPGRPKKDDDNKKTRYFKIRLTEKEYKDLKEVASDRGVSMSALTLHLINEECKKYDKKMLEMYFNGKL